MKKLMLFFCAALLSVSLVLSGALAEAVPVEFTVKGARYDMTEDEFAAWGEQAFHAGDWWDGSRLLADYPLLTEAVMKLYDEVRNNSSTLEKNENYVSWHTDALKVVFDERMMGVRVWVEFGSEDRKLDMDITENVLWHDGELQFVLPEGYAFEEISALRISYQTECWPNSWGHAWLYLTYDVSGGKVICRSIDTEMDSGRFIICWWMGRKSDTDEMYLEGMFYDLAVDAEFSETFDLKTGKCVDY